MSRVASIAIAAAAFLGGCAAHRHGVAAAAAIHAGSQCGDPGTGPSARWIGDEAGLRSALFGGASIGGAGVAPPPVNLSTEGVVLVSAGTRPTAGWTIALGEEAVALADGVATIVVRIDGPAAGAIVAQVLTNPCLLVRLPREGIGEVRVVDPAGAMLAIAPARRAP